MPTPEETQAYIKEMEAKNEHDYAAGVESTDPDSLIGQIVRAFPPMGVDQLLERTAKARMDSTMEASLKAQPSRPRTTAVLGPFDSPEQLADAESAALRNLEAEREYKLNRVDDPAPAPPSHLATCGTAYRGCGPGCTFQVYYEMYENARNEPLLQFFSYANLPPNLQTVSVPFCNLAHDIVSGLPRNPQRTMALEWLLLAKDAAVRAVLYKEQH